MAYSLLVLMSLSLAPTAAAEEAGVCSGIPTTGSGLFSGRYEQRVVPVTFVGAATVVEFVEQDDAIYARLLLDGELRDAQGRVLHEVNALSLYNYAVAVTGIAVDADSGNLVLTLAEGAIKPGSWVTVVQPAPLEIHADDAGRTAGLIRAVAASLKSGSTNATVTLLNSICAR